MNENCIETYRVKKNSVIELVNLLFFSRLGKLFLWARLFIGYLIETYPFLRRKAKSWLGE